MQALWYDGSDWTVMAQIDDGEEDNQLHYYQINLPAGAAENPAFALKFKLNGSGTGDYGYVDNVVLEGYPAAPSAPVADFSASPLAGQVTLSVDFTDLSSKSPTSWSWTFGDGGSSTAQNPSHDYTSSGVYTVSLTATNSLGQDTETKTDYISVAPSGTPDEIFSDDFEAEFSGWTTSGNVNWYTGSPKNGTHSIQLLKVGSMDQTISTVGYEYIKVSFYMGANSLDNSSENVQALWTDDGSDWSVLAQIDDGEEDNQLHYYEFWMPQAAAENANFALKFKINGSGLKDYMYVDDVVVGGTVSGPPPAPVADFSGTPTSGDAPLTVNFTDLSSNSPTSWDWTFGDGGSSAAQNPSHEYTSDGDYTVSLTAENASGQDTETKTDYISVSEPPPAPVADFSGTPLSGDAPLTVNFTDLSSNSPTSWDWTFGDGGSSAAQNPSHEYTSAGDYTVSLTAENASGQDTETKTNYISVSEPPPPPPTADFSGTPTSGDAPLTVNFTDLSTGSPTSWDWTFGDGGSSTAQNPSHEYTSAGDYTVSLTATNAQGQDTETKTDYISVSEPGGEETVFMDDFESGLSGWYTEGSITAYSGEPKIGTQSCQLQGNSCWMEKSAPTTGYTDISFCLYIGAKDFEAWETLVVYWYDGSGWDSIKTISNGDPEEDGQLHYIEIALPSSADNNSSVKVGFGQWTADSGDYGYIDNVELRGTPQ